MRIQVWSQPRQIVHETSISKITRAKWTWAVAHVYRIALWVDSLEFKPQSHKKKKRTKGVQVHKILLIAFIIMASCQVLYHLKLHLQSFCF
jgi:hypothetical protein